MALLVDWSRALLGNSPSTTRRPAWRLGTHFTAAVEPLEDRRLLAPVTVTGRNFEDLNGNAVDDTVQATTLPAGSSGDWLSDGVAYAVHVVEDFHYQDMAFVASGAGGINLFNVTWAVDVYPIFGSRSTAGEAQEVSATRALETEQYASGTVDDKQTIDDALRMKIWEPGVSWTLTQSAQAILSGSFDSREIHTERLEELE